MGPTTNRQGGKLCARLFLLACSLVLVCAPAVGQEFTIDQTLSDEAQRTTIAFDGLAFLSGSLGADSFFPPGKVADFWGFQYLRDNDPTHMGHNTSFLTRASLTMLTILTPAERQTLIALAERQVDAINLYGMERFVLMTAFRRLLSGDLPAAGACLDRTAVAAFSAELYGIDGRISYERAKVMGGLLAGLTPAQRQQMIDGCNVRRSGLRLGHWRAHVEHLGARIEKLVAQQVKRARNVRAEVGGL